MINFNPHFDLEDRDCKYDYVEVFDGENENGRLWGKFCGKIAPPPVVSSGQFLFIKFVSDYETHGAGFSIRYEIFKRGPECSQNYTTPSGVIKSPGFPEKYPNSLECTYIVFAPKMSEIILEFESFDLEPDSNPPGGCSVAMTGWKSGMDSLTLALTLGVTVDRKHQVESDPHRAFSPWFLYRQRNSKRRFLSKLQCLAEQCLRRFQMYGSCGHGIRRNSF